MGRATAASRVAVVSLVLVTGGCLSKEPLSGTLTVFEPLSINAPSPVQLQPGLYPVRVSADDRREVVLAIDRRADGHVTTRLPVAGLEAPGEARVEGSQSGQPFDLAYTLGSATTETPLSSSARSCRIDTTERQCRTVRDPDSPGGLELREECGDVPVYRAGVRTEQAVRAVSTTTLYAQFTDVRSGRELAHFTATASRERKYSVESACR